MDAKETAHPQRRMRVDDLPSDAVVKVMFSAIGIHSGWWILAAQVPIKDGKRSSQYLLASMPAGSMDVLSADIEVSYPGTDEGLARALSDAERACERERRCY